MSSCGGAIWAAGANADLMLLAMAPNGLLALLTDSV
jgi:hypothetical protein